MCQRLRRFDRCYQHVHESIVKRLELGPNCRVLDVGCGAGGVAALLAQRTRSHGGRLVALDINPDHLAATRQRVETECGAGFGEFRQGDVEDLPFPGGEFDLIWCSRVVHHHFPHPRSALSEMYRVLKAQGQLVLREGGGGGPSFASPRLGIDRELVARLYRSQTLWFQSKYKTRRPADSRRWTSEMQDAGFEAIEVRGFAFEASSPRHQASFLLDWLRDRLKDHRDPKHGNLLLSEDAQRVEKAAGELETLLERQDGELDAMDFGMAHRTLVYTGRK